MHLQSHIITPLPQTSQPPLKSSFQHPVQLKAIPSKQDQDYFLIQLLNIPESSLETSSCLVTFNFSFEAQKILCCLNETDAHWSCTINKYDLRTGEVRASKKYSSLDVFDGNGIKSEDQAYLYELVVSYANSSSIKKAYFIPPNLDNQKNVTGSDYQMLRIISYIKGYISLEEKPQQTILFQSDLSCSINAFLYEEKVKKITIVLNNKGQVSDKKIIQQASQLKVPEKWCQKDSYRQLKRQIFVLKSKDNTFQKQIKRVHKDVTQTVNSLQALAGLPQLPYSQITVEQLKHLKREGFSEKVNRITDTKQSVEFMDLRLVQLQSRKEELQNMKKNIQNQQLGEILFLKSSVLSLQTSSVNAKTHQQSRLIFKRDKPQVQKQILNTILSRAQKKHHVHKNSFLTNHTILRSKRKSSIKIRIEQVEKKSKNQFKTNDKKIAAFVKQGQISSHEINFNKLRQQYEAQQLEVDFQLEKILQNKQISYHKALDNLRKLIDGTDDLQFI